MGINESTGRPITLTRCRGPGTLVATVTTPRCGKRLRMRTVHAVNANGSRFDTATATPPACD